MKRYFLVFYTVTNFGIKKEYMCSMSSNGFPKGEKILKDLNLHEEKRKCKPDHLGITSIMEITYQDYKDSRGVMQKEKKDESLHYLEIVFLLLSAFALIWGLIIITKELLKH